MKSFASLSVSVSLCFLLSTAAVCQPGSPEKELSAADVMKKMDGQKQPDTMISEMTMTLIGKNGDSRQRSVLTARKGKNNTIMWFLSPADWKGASFLSMMKNSVTSMWIYLPALSQEPSMVSSRGKKGSFMGSDFTYEDLEGRKLKDHDYKMLGTEKVLEKDCYVIESTPRPELANPSYSKIESWIWKDRLMPLKEKYYNKLGTLSKEQTIFELKNFKTYWIPMKIAMENLEKKQKTEIQFNNVQVDVSMDETIFNQRSLKRIFNKSSLYKVSKSTTTAVDR